MENKPQDPIHRLYDDDHLGDDTAANHERSVTYET